MIVLVVGATGQLVAKQLLNWGHKVSMIVRSPGKLIEIVMNNDNLDIISTSLLELRDSEMIKYTNNCNAATL